LVYLVAQILFVTALNLGPFAVISALFTMVLVFDAAIASKFLGTKFSFNHIVGLVIIMLAVIACAVFSPKSEYDVTAKAMTKWAATTGGIVFLSLMFLLVLKGIILVHFFEKKYPDFPKGRENVPVSTVILMRIVYPMILAVFETLGASSLKGVLGMVLLMGTEEGQLTHPAFWLTFLMWITCIVNTIVWLRKVYAKYPTAECLPTEIGKT
jgi:drug/metabolite transporter (DMT)-like permease